MKSLISLFALLTLSSTLAFATTPVTAPVPGLLGQWDAENVLLGREAQFRLTFNFSQFSSEMTVHCLFNDGSRLTATTNSDTAYSENSIFILENKQTITDDSIHFCRATLNKATWTAYFNGTGKMILFVPAPYQSQFTLVPHVPAPAPLM